MQKKLRLHKNLAKNEICKPNPEKLFGMNSLQTD
jgi:hypothetical protein